MAKIAVPGYCARYDAECAYKREYLAEMRRVRGAITEYIRTKIAWTTCKQKHFRQVCNRCSEQAGCKVQGRYVEAWMQLQKANEEEK